MANFMAAEKGSVVAAYFAVNLLAMQKVGFFKKCTFTVTIKVP